MKLHRRGFSAAVAAGAIAPHAAAQNGAPAPKVLRYAFLNAETGFDPAQLSDIYSRDVTCHIFESPLCYDPLARPHRLMPLTAEAMPERSSDYRRLVFRIRPGIFFADDPAFKGRQRELVAADYVYSFKRILDPKLKSPSQPSAEDDGILGLNELRAKALKDRTPFDYDTEIEGLRTLDRYTFEVRTREPKPRLIYNWVVRDIGGALAREVVEFYGDKIMEHPVGTGPFRLVQWRRSSFIALERNPNYRDVRFQSQPREGDAEGAAIAAKLNGRRLPMIDRVECSVIEEQQPRWLAFLAGEHDFMERLPNEFIGQAAPGGKLAPFLAKRGVQMWRTPASDVTLTVYNMDHPVIGGVTPDKVALRRAMNLGADIGREINVVRRGQAIAAQSILVPGTSGYDAQRRTEMGAFDPARAKALLDLFGYVDRDGDGWRELPDGRPLLLDLATQSDQTQRALDEVWKKNMDALGIRVNLRIGQWAENLKSVRAGNFTMWRVGSSAASPDGQGALTRLHGASVGKGNLSRFRNADFDAIYDRLSVLPDGPEREALFERATKYLVAFAPYRVHVHRILTDLASPKLVGWRRPLFWREWWMHIDIDEGETARSA